MALPVAALKWAGKAFTKGASAAGRAASAEAGGQGGASGGGGGGSKKFGVFAVVGVIGVALAMFVGVLASAISMLNVISASTAGATAVAMNACNTNVAGSDTPSQEALADIPAVALQAYQRAGTASGINWIYIAAIGKIESDHGRNGGRHLNAKGDEVDSNGKRSDVIGPALNGNGYAAIRDTDNGKYDHDTVWDHAVGVVQFIPSTWKAYAKDGDYDGDTDPQNVWDGAMSTAFYLKANGAPGNMHDAIWHYNHSEDYIAKVLAQAEAYKGAAASAASTGAAGAASVKISAGSTSPVNGTIGIAHANIPTRSGDAGFKSTLATMLNKKPDFVTLNEQTQRSLAFIESAAPGYSAYRDASKPDNQALDEVVLWRDAAWTKVDSGRIQIVADDHSMYDGKEVVWSRYAVWAVMKRKSDGALASVVSVHNMTNPGKFGPNKPLRQQNYGKGMDTLTGLLGTLSTHGPVFVGGDFNVQHTQTASWAAVPKMDAAGYTYFNNGVDYIFYQQHNGVALNSHAIGDTTEPDHRWLYAKFKMTDAAAMGVGGPSGNLKAAAAPNMYAAAKKKTKKTTDSTDQAGGWVTPVKGNPPITATFNQLGGWSGGWGVAPGHHEGLDYGVGVGTPVYAANAGTVQYDPGNEGWAGPNLVEINHGGGVITWYAHLSKRVVPNGAQVTAGQLIGYSGAMGNVTGPHLHFQVTVNGTAVDPKTFLAGAGVPVGGAGGDDCGPTGSSGVVGGNGQWGGYQNGRIPLTAMCTLSFQPSVYLECNAAKSLEQFNAAYQKKFGRSFSPVGGYRSYEEQVVCYNNPDKITSSGQHLCATPGTSNHGWGLAADLSNGHFQGFGTADYKWAVKHAPDYGWLAPDWARANGSKPEPWHFEYGGSGLQTGSTEPNSSDAQPKAVPAAWNHFYHNETYRKENSIAGLNAAVKGNYPAIDLDANVTKDGVVVNTHWDDLTNDGFYDPQGKIKNLHVTSLTWAQVSRLRTHDGYQILPMDTMLKEAASRGLRVEIELKPGNWSKSGVMSGLAASVQSSGVRAQVKTISNLGNALDRLKLAHGAGLTTIILPRGDNKVSKTWWPYIDYVRGTVHWT